MDPNPDHADDDELEARIRERLGDALDYEPQRRCVECGAPETDFERPGRFQPRLEGPRPICRRCYSARRFQHIQSYRRQVRASGIRHEAMIRGARTTRATFTVDDVAERDGWICQLCGDRVDPDVDRRTADGATIDHIVPVTKGGAHELDNVQLAHRGCNSRKGNRPWPPRARESRGHYRLGPLNPFRICPRIHIM